MKVSFKSLVLPAFLVLFLLGGCGSTQQQGGDENVGGEQPKDELNLELNADSDSGRAGPLQTVYFDFDSYALRGDARAALDGNVSFMKENPSVEIQVEGHCDERGGIQYNLALGENRANAVRDYLVAAGVEARRVSTISFGKERPVAFGHSEDSWSKNRRGNFVITAK